MKNKVIISSVIFILLLLGIVFANSYVQALSREEKILDNQAENTTVNYSNIREKTVNCYNYCEQNENCPIYQENGYCTTRNNHCQQRSYDCTREYGRHKGCR